MTALSEPRWQMTFGTCVVAGVYIDTLSHKQEEHGVRFGEQVMDHLRMAPMLVLTSL